ncbi:MAG TPA: ribosome maturation factor RimP [Acidimicrobiaceae bacterium]|jgi:ribosome maturation factor RimP|nr:ribosome maturation factor RimP [Actinomycetota bacterium]NCG40596.1 ribosome maturation factor RimP [Actinomycetota bacterium]HAN08913.1 ribosome maturation factor RimP [Acidimicrobiaceae bacterium]|tara:strand:+ start:1871 stop:2383 length:513 start_codon:yes stop_codon:yes gene_type:complete
MSETDKILQLVAPIVSDAGYELYDVQRNDSTLSVLVQGLDGVSIDELTNLSRAVSALLDEHDPIPGRYTLEVSSPGVERRLRNIDHFASAVGEQVHIRTFPGPDGRRRIAGLLKFVDSDMITVEDPESGVCLVRFDEIEKARTIFAWGPGPKPGKGAKPTTAKIEGGSQT